MIWYWASDKPGTSWSLNIGIITTLVCAPHKNPTVCNLTKARRYPFWRVMQSSCLLTIKGLGESVLLKSGETASLCQFANNCPSDVNVFPARVTKTGQAFVHNDPKVE